MGDKGQEGHHQYISPSTPTHHKHQKPTKKTQQDATITFNNSTTKAKTGTNNTGCNTYNITRKIQHSKKQNKNKQQQHITENQTPEQTKPTDTLNDSEWGDKLTQK